MGRLGTTSRALLLTTVGAAYVLFTAHAAEAKRVELAELSRPAVELTAPPAHATLVGGTTAEIAWQPAAGFTELAGANEWEAFLSVDGGKSYPVRLTPHLDLDRRRFAFRVPDLPSDDVRLLLRIGDERIERAMRLPARLRIVRSAAPTPPALEAALLVAPAPGPGESALEGGAGVLFWVEGDRDGSHLRHRAAAPAGARAGSDPTLSGGDTETLGSEESFTRHLTGRSAPTTHPAAARDPSWRSAYLSPAIIADILLLIQRQNE